MAEPELEKERQREELRSMLPLVIEIMPGQASEGLVDIHEAGSYQEGSLRQLVEKTLGQSDAALAGFHGLPHPPGSSGHSLRKGGSN